MFPNAVVRQDFVKVNKWYDTETHRWWIYVSNVYDYQTFVNQPKVLEWNNLLFVISGFNSDSGNCGYRQANSDDLAKIGGVTKL